MIICEHCHHKNPIGELFCQECGKSLVGLKVSATVPTRTINTDLDEVSAKSTWGSATVGRTMSILFHISESSEPVVLSPTKRITLGRADSNNENNPDVDLVPYGALEKGVSRQHAAIELNEDTLLLFDVGSSNGTYLNGQRLLPNQPRVLRDGDEVRLGKLVAHVYFK